MATRLLTKAEALPALETFELDLLRRRSAQRVRSRVWARGALLLDAVLLVAAGVATQLGSGDAGIVRIAAPWLAIGSLSAYSTGRPRSWLGIGNLAAVASR